MVHALESDKKAEALYLLSIVQTSQNTITNAGPEYRSLRYSTNNRLREILSDGCHLSSRGVFESRIKEQLGRGSDRKERKRKWKEIAMYAEKEQLIAVFPSHKDFFLDLVVLEPIPNFPRYEHGFYNSKHNARPTRRDLGTTCRSAGGAHRLLDLYRKCLKQRLKTKPNNQKWLIRKKLEKTAGARYYTAIGKEFTDEIKEAEFDAFDEMVAEAFQQDEEAAQRTALDESLDELAHEVDKFTGCVEARKRSWEEFTKHTEKVLQICKKVKVDD
ncbi:hypothetical protein LTR66_017106 [Elasticomyces elasticus]|nr:hypothetical protein LTR66_017106 [Elasticomyces elasticus]